MVSGTCAEQMYGMCESLWEPDMVSRWQEEGKCVRLADMGGNGVSREKATAAESETLSARALVWAG